MEVGSDIEVRTLDLALRTRMVKRTTMAIPADEVLSLVADDLECDLAAVQAVLAEDLHCPNQGCPARLVIMEQVAPKQHTVHLQHICTKLWLASSLASAIEKLILAI